jgi:hypothetical protein
VRPLYRGGTLHRVAHTRETCQTPVAPVSMGHLAFRFSVLTGPKSGEAVFLSVCAAVRLDDSVRVFRIRPRCFTV